MEKIVHKEVIKEVTVGVSEEELSKARGRAEIDRCASWKLDAIEQTPYRVDGAKAPPHDGTPRDAPLVSYRKSVALVRHVVVDLPPEDELLRVQDEHVQNQLEER